MRNKKTIVAIALFNLGCSIATWATETEQKYVANSIEKHAKTLLKDERFSSLTIGVFKSGKIYKGYFGELTHGAGNRPNDKTLFEIGSVSKTMTGLVAAKAVLEGKLLLESDINQYLQPKLLNLSPKDQPVTVRQLLTHTSGIAANVGDIGFSKGDKALNRDSFLQAINDPARQMKRSQYQYSNLAPNVLAYVLESVYQQPFAVLLQDTLQAIGMNSSKMTLVQTELRHFAYGYNDKGEEMPAFTDAPDLWGAAGRVKTTLPDLLRFIEFQLDNNQPLAKESQKVLLDKGGRYDTSYYWRSNVNDVGRYFQHHGGLYGTQNWLIVYPQYQMGISIIANVSFDNVGSLLKEVSDAIVDDIKPFGKKSIKLAIQAMCMRDTQACIEHYWQLKKQHNNDYGFDDEEQLNGLGYKFLGRNETTKAIKILTLLTEEFPQSFNAFDSLGEAYYLAKNHELARLNYQKSLALNQQNHNAEKMIQIINEYINF